MRYMFFFNFYTSIHLLEVFAHQNCIGIADLHQNSPLGTQDFRSTLLIGGLDEQ